SLFTNWAGRSRSSGLRWTIISRRITGCGFRGRSEASSVMAQVSERARRYIARCPPAISGAGGHDATFHVAAVLVWGFALSETEALMLLQEWNQNCVPPWSEAELVHKVRSAGAATHADQRGHLI